MARGRVYFATIAAAAALGACRLFVDLGGIDDGAPLDAAPGAEAGADAPGSDGAGDGNAGDGAKDGGADVAVEADAGDASAPITFVDTSLAPDVGGSVTSLDVSKPAGVIADDLVLVGLFTDVAATSATAPAGYTKLGDTPSPGDTHGWWYVHTVGAVEPAKTTFTFSPATPFASAVAVAYRNVRLVNPVDVSAFAQNAANPLIAPAVTTTVANTMLVAIYLADDTPTAIWQAPTGMTARGDTGICAAFDSPFVTPGTTGDRSANNNKNVAASTGLIALAPK